MKKYNSIKVLFVLSLVLSVIFALFVPSSAAVDPTESDQVIIPAGTYRWNDILTEYNQYSQSVVDYHIPITITLPYTISQNDSGVYIDNTPSTQTFTGVAIQSVVNSVYYDGFALSLSYAQDSTRTPGFYVNQPDEENGFTVPHYWDALYYVYKGIIGDIPNLDLVKGAGQTFSVLVDTSVDSSFYDWFSANTNNGGEVDPDPDPDHGYTISAGWYLWQEELLGEFIPHTLTFNYRTFQRVADSGMPFYSYWSRMQFDNFVEDDSYFSRLYYSSISNGQVLVYDDINGGWVDETYRRFYISSPLTLSAEDYFIFNAYTEYYGDTPPSFPGETVPSVPDPDSNIFSNIIGGVLEALDAFTIFGGFSLLDLLTTLLGGMALIWILKLLAGG